jgi:hypothetical protein|tara:strand:+ start:551 stop:1000 length:450 start_codon:yes stop_codon:yes gene_type:complete
MTVKVKIKSKLNQKISKAIDLYESNTSGYLNKVANMYRNYIMRGMHKTPKDGNTYIRGGEVHIASSKDNPPAIDTGTLVNSFFVQPATSNRLFSAVLTRVSYANILEQSFARGGLQRPFMGKESQAFKDAQNYANLKYKDIEIGNRKIT